MESATSSLSQSRCISHSLMLPCFVLRRSPVFNPTLSAALISPTRRTIRGAAPTSFPFLWMLRSKAAHNVLVDVYRHPLRTLVRLHLGRRGRDFTLVQRGKVLYLVRYPLLRLFSVQTLLIGLLGHLATWVVPSRIQVSTLRTTSKCRSVSARVANLFLTGRLSKVSSR